MIIALVAAMMILSLPFAAFHVLNDIGKWMSEVWIDKLDARIKKVE